MPEAPEKLDLKSLDLGEEKRQELLRLFPEIRTEGGKIDFDRLKLALGEMVDVGKERYGMHWPGKADCFKTIQAPSMGTLRPCPEESVNFDTTENLIIEGDNLEVLKLLQKSYLGRVKMIYIDPPYNTGNDFIYPDNYSESLQTYLEYTGQVDAQGRKFGTNTDTDGRFHSKWMNMMYPRLYLARNLLKDDGIICISIDDNELINLRSVMNEVFGESGFISNIIIQSNKRGQTYKEIAKTHEYLVIYSRDPDVSLFELEKEGDSLPFNDGMGPFDLWELRNRNPKFGRFNRPNLFFPIYVSSNLKDTNGYSLISLEQNGEFNIEAFPRNSSGEDGCWRWGKDKLRTSDLTGTYPVVVAKQRRDGEWNIYEKSRKSMTKAKSLWVETEVISEQGTVELGELSLADCFDHPKPLGLLKKCIQICSSDDDVILDFFAGSGTLAHAILDLNKAESKIRRFVAIQLPEPTRTQKVDGTWDESAAWKAGFTTISDLTKERIRRAIKKLNSEDSSTEGTLFKSDRRAEDRGFRVFKLTDSNFKPWDTEVPHESGALAQQLDLYIDHIKDGRSNQDLLFEILLKRGFPLTTPVKALTLAGHEVFGVAGSMMLVCLERDLSMDLIRAMADLKPECIVCLDEGFAGNDQLKTNAVQIFKTKGIAKFLTV